MASEKPDGNTFKDIVSVKLQEIDLESTVNVRTQDVSENVKKVKKSIQKHGYWPDQPIVLREHPNSDSDYVYEYVTGQCRLKAVRELEHTEILAVIKEDLKDDEALQRSWSENEARGNLSLEDKSRIAKQKFKEYDDGNTIQEARRKAAEWLGVNEETFKKYYRLSFLPKEIYVMITRDKLTETDGNTIVEYTYDHNNEEKSKEKMIERANWLKQFKPKERKLARQAIASLNQPNTEIAELENWLKENKNKQQRVIKEYALPADIYAGLLDYAQKHHIPDDRIEGLIENVIYKVLESEKLLKTKK